MSQFIETIRILDGIIQNPRHHQSRFNRARQDSFNLKDHPSLDQLIRVPERFREGTCKCRILYGRDIELIEYLPYKAMIIKSLKLVYSESIRYNYKFSNRAGLEELFAQRGSCDDIIIIRQGCITDSYMANVVLWNGSGWVTPDTPLLEGTMRASLMEKGMVTEERITTEDLSRYHQIRLINAMRDLDAGDPVPVNALVY